MNNMVERIQRQFRRLVRTGDFESVEVVATIDREIDYTNADDRRIQIQMLMENETDQMVFDLNMVLDKMGCSEKRIMVKSNRPRPTGV